MDEKDIADILEALKKILEEYQNNQKQLVEAINKLVNWMTNASIGSLAFIVNLTMQLYLRRGIGEEKEILTLVVLFVSIATITGIFNKLLLATRSSFLGDMAFTFNEQKVLKNTFHKVLEVSLSDKDFDAMEKEVLRKTADDIFCGKKTWLDRLSKSVLRLTTSPIVIVSMLNIQILSIVVGLVFNGFFLISFILEAQIFSKEIMTISPPAIIAFAGAISGLSSLFLFSAIFLISRYQSSRII